MTPAAYVDTSQDVLGQLPRLKTYTHVLLCFPLRDGLSETGVVSSLRTAATTLANAFPWMTCKVLHSGSGPSDSGTFTLAPCPELASPDAIIRVKDCTCLCLPYQDIVAARGPVDLLDGSTLGPAPAFPHIYNDTELNPAPVFTVQTNIVRGGILLDAAAQHNVIDGGGLLHLLKHLARCMRGEDLPADALEAGNLERSKVITLLGPDEAMLDHSHLIREPFTHAQAAQPSPPPDKSEAFWRFERFPGAKVAALKSRATEDLVKEHGSFVSTNDAMCAFVWKRIAAVRLKRRQRSDDFSKFSRALDARRALRIPPDYLGQMGYNASCRLTFRELEEWSLGQVALFMRQAVQQVNNEYSVRSWATFIAKEPDKSRIMFGGSFDPDTDIGLSSLIHASLHDIEFGALGKPDLVRRPRFAPMQSCVYFWTHTSDGDIEVLLCLKREDWEALHADAEWSAHTESMV